MPGTLWKKIVCATDFSDSSEAALLAAIDLASRLHAELVLLHVGAGGEQELEARKQQALKGGVTAVTISTETGDPSTRIVEAADKGKFDLIVMGTRGRTGRAASLAGSVAESVVRRASCPVLTLNDGWKR